jgi:hypothetical protein
MLTLKNILKSSKPNILSRNFSVFSKLRDFMRSGGQSSGSVTYPVEVDNIKIEYDEPDKSLKNKKKIKKPQHLETPEEIQARQNDIISI